MNTFIYRFAGRWLKIDHDNPTGQMKVEYNDGITIVSIVSLTDHDSIFKDFVHRRVLVDPPPERVKSSLLYEGGKFIAICSARNDLRSREFTWRGSKLYEGIRIGNLDMKIVVREYDENDNNYKMAELEFNASFGCDIYSEQATEHLDNAVDNIHTACIDKGILGMDRGLVRTLIRKYTTYRNSECGNEDGVEMQQQQTNQQNNNSMTNEVDGIVYAITNDNDRSYVHSYHRKPNPLNHAVGAKHVDIAGVATRKLPKVVRVDNAGDYRSKFTIGFEIEKNELDRSALKEYPLFCGFETDGSCGYEAVTNILPLVPQSKWRDKVFNLMDEAEQIIDDRYSPSDQRCGGHITIAVEGLTGVQLMSRIRKNCGIVYALWRHRLKNRFCNQNTNMYPTSREPRWSNRRRTVNGFSRYSVATAKGNCLEFRIPHRLSSVKQLKLRYELFYEIVDFTINSPRTDHAKLLERLRPIIEKMYDHNQDRVNKVMGLADAFRTFILTKTITEPIAHVLCPDGAYTCSFSSVEYDTELTTLYDDRTIDDNLNNPEWRARFKRAFPNYNLQS
jgi:hypothetical protein